jgi:glycerophosphoryl diester phosphodiesterase
MAAMDRFYPNYGSSTAPRHPFFAASRPLVFAHRGASGLAPENTLVAFDAGLAHGADGLELDVRLSRDGVAVVHHDATLERTTNLRGRVAQHTAEELAQADAAARFEPQNGLPFRGKGLGVPTLVDVLSRFPDTKVIIEIKDNTRELASAVIEAIRQTNATDRVCVGSFGRRAVNAVRSLDPGVATSAAREEVRWALYRSWCHWPIGQPRYGGYQVPELAGRTRVVSKQFVDWAHRAGLAVQVWTVDTLDDAERLLAWGVDAIITNRPDIIVPFVIKYGQTNAP